MAEYLDDRRDVEFILYEHLGVQRLCEYDKYSEFSKDVFDMVLDLTTPPFISSQLPPPGYFAAADNANALQ